MTATDSRFEKALELVRAEAAVLDENRVAVLAADDLADFSDFSNFSVPRASVASTDLAASDGDDLSADAFTAGAGLASAPVKPAAAGDRADVGAVDGGVPETSSPPGAGVTTSS